jgi:hypothetical protein
MEPPHNVRVHTNATSLWWMEEPGILVSISKKDAPQIGREQSRTQIEEVWKAAGEKKVCLLLDITHAKPGKREDREFAAEELAKLVKAMALISSSPLGKMVANLFFNLKPPPYPTKMFTDENEARKWLLQYL